MKNNRNLLYPIPISEIDEDKMRARISKILGRTIDKINLQIAAEHNGILSAYWECKNIDPLKIDGEEIHPAALVAYLTQCPESLSLAFRHAHGIQRFNIMEMGKKNKSNKEYKFAVTDFEFHEDMILMFGEAKNQEARTEKEYLVCLDLDRFEFFKLDILGREVCNKVFFDNSISESKRLSTIIMYAYKYMKRSDEIRLSKLTELLTGTFVKKPGKQMFEVLNRSLKNPDIDENRKELILNTLETAFHRYVQTSKERNPGFYVQDKEGSFILEMEEIRPCKEKKGLRCRGLRVYDNAPWNNYRMNIEYDYKTNSISVYNDDWQKQKGILQWEETDNNNAEIKNLRRCINCYYLATQNWVK